VWIGVTDRERSFRPYRSLEDIWAMVARSAYTQLRYSTGLLAGTVVGLVLIYLVPPLLVLTAPLHRSPGVAVLAALAWSLMTLTYLPTLRLYGLSPLRGLTLPVSGLLYLGMTLDSARLHRQGRGAQWKGRVGAGHV
jgi:hypothetical protein